MPYRDPRISPAERNAVDALVALQNQPIAQVHHIERQLGQLQQTQQRQMRQQQHQQQQQRQQQQQQRRQRQQVATRAPSPSPPNLSRVPLQFKWRGAPTTGMPTFRERPARTPLQFAAPKKKKK